MKGVSPSLLIVGLDGASEAIVRCGIDAGQLPTFRRLRDDSMTGSLRCTWPPHTASGWTSLFSGRLPGEHAHYQFWDCQDPSYGTRLIGSRERGCPLIWDVFAEAGRTLGLINIPMSHPPGAWPGYEISWPLEPTIHYSRPRSLLRELAAVGGHHLPDIACMFDGTDDYVDRAERYVAARTRSLRFLLSHRPTDAVAVVYPEIDRVCHHYWSVFDPTHPQYGSHTRRSGGAIPRIYQAIDKALDELLDLVPKSCTVLVVSDHGFGPGKRGVRLHHLLADASFCDVAPSPEKATSQPGDYLRDFNWAGTSAYIPVPGCWGLNVNLAGRQREGIIEKDAQSRLLDELSEFVLDLREPLTNEPLFMAAVRGLRAFAGPFSKSAPDLLLVPRDPGLMLLEDLQGPTWDLPRQCGLHRLEGIWMLRTANRPAEQIDMLPVEAVAAMLLDEQGLASPLFPTHAPESAFTRMEQAGLPPTAWSCNEEPPVTWPPAARSNDLECVQPLCVPQQTDLSEDVVVQRLRDMGYL